jgi:hypothetical protein
MSGALTGRCETCAWFRRPMYCEFFDHHTAQDKTCEVYDEELEDGPDEP